MTIRYTSKKLEKDFGPLTFGDLLLLQREDEELTQVEMAKKLGITENCLLHAHASLRYACACRTSARCGVDLVL